MLREIWATILQGLAPVVIRTATVTGTGVDVSNAGTVLITVNVGVITDGTHTLAIEESAVLGSGYTAVDPTQLVGTVGALVSATPVQFQYLGTKQFLRVKVTVTNSPSTGGYYDAQIILLGQRKQS